MFDAMYNVFFGGVVECPMAELVTASDCYTTQYHRKVVSSSLTGAVVLAFILILSQWKARVGGDEAPLTINDYWQYCRRAG